MSGVEVIIVLNLIGGIIGVASSVVASKITSLSWRRKLDKIGKAIETIGNSSNNSNVSNVSNEPINEVVEVPRMEESPQTTQRELRVPVWNYKTSEIEFLPVI